MLFIALSASRQFGVLQSTAFDLSLNSETVLHFNTYEHDFSNFCGLKGFSTGDAYSCRLCTIREVGPAHHRRICAKYFIGRCWNHCVIVVITSSSGPLTKAFLHAHINHYQKKGSWPDHERRVHVEQQRSSPCNPPVSTTRCYVRFCVQSGPFCHMTSMCSTHPPCTRWFRYDRDCLHLFTHKSVPVIFEPPCIRSDEGITFVLMYWFMQQPKEYFAFGEWVGCFSTHGRACILLSELRYVSQLNLQFLLIHLLTCFIQKTDPLALCTLVPSVLLTSQYWIFFFYSAVCNCRVQ